MRWSKELLIGSVLAFLCSSGVVLAEHDDEPIRVEHHEVSAPVLIGTQSREKNIHLLVHNEIADTREWLEVPNDEDGCKSDNITYIDYRMITCKTSNQWVLQHQEDCYTDPDTGIRMVGDRYCIAVGTAWAYEIGTYIDIEMENGTEIQCILADVKADGDTDEENKYCLADGSVVEFVVDTTVFQSVMQYPTGCTGKVRYLSVG